MDDQGTIWIKEEEPNEIPSSPGSMVVHHCDQCDNYRQVLNVKNTEINELKKLVGALRSQLQELRSEKLTGGKGIDEAREDHNLKHPANCNKNSDWKNRDHIGRTSSESNLNLLQDQLTIEEPCFDIKEDPELKLNEGPYEQSLCQEPLKIEEPGFDIKEDPDLELNVGPSEHSVCSDPLKIEELCFHIKEDPGLESNVDPSERSGGVVRWCLQRGLIAKGRTCDKCSRPMRIVSRKGLNDGVVWSCKKESHISRCSIRRKSWFAGSRLAMGDILKITYLWVHKCSNAFITEKLNISSHTVVEWRSFCREVCVKDCITYGDVLGGVGSVVEIIQAKLVKQKYVKGQPITDGWVFGGIERGSNKCFFEVVPRTTKSVFLNVLKKYVLPETTVISECFRSYDCLSDEEFIDLSVKHKLNFKDPVLSNRNPIEGSWPWIKRYFRQTKRSKDVFDSHLFEYMWRRKWSDENDLFIKFLEAVCRVYNPD